jgi:predicted ATPase/DNA-binding SARP family transcriptional activator
VTTELMLLTRVAYRRREITGPLVRALLALLAEDLRAGVSTARLVAALWRDEQPENPAKALQILVSRARGQLGADVIARTPTGYRLALPAEQVDAAAALLRASEASRAADAGEHRAALAHAEAGLALWDGAAAGDEAPDDPLSALRAGRAAAYRSLRRSRALALARLGRHAEAAGPLAEVADAAEGAGDHPGDEEVLLELLRAEAATVGAAAALARYERYRRALRDRLGTDPGQPLQAVHQELLRDAEPAVRHGIQHEPNPLLGREDDIAAVGALLRTSRVVSIVGPGGLGKTRLAHAVSGRAPQRVVHVVALAAVADDADVAGAVAAALGVGESRRTPVGHPLTPAGALTGIADALGAGHALLVLDNCEHLIAGVADLVHALVAATRDVRVLTTSRAPLGLSSESVYPLPELDLDTAVELFGQRARAARRGVELPAQALTELCRHLDGLPLAVELAAARVRAMSVDEIASRLQDRFSLLSGGSRDAPHRHRTLHAVVDWSWNLLAPDGQAAMRALSVFPGGFSAEAAGRLLGGDALGTVEHLVDQSLLKVSDTGAGTRFEMLETVREFSAAQRDACGETAQVFERFLAWARDFGLAHHQTPLGAARAAPIDRIRAEQDNLRQALRHAVSTVDGDAVAAVTAVLGALWTLEANYAGLGMLSEDAAWVLSHYRPAPEYEEVTRTAAVLLTGYAYSIEGPRAVRALVVLRRLPAAPPDTLVRAMATVLRAIGPDPATLTALCESDEPMLAGTASGVASYLWEFGGDTAGAFAATERMLALFRYFDVPLAHVFAHSRLAELHMNADRGVEAAHHLEAALRIQEAVGLRSDALGLRGGLVLASLQTGAIEDAARWLEQAMATSSDETFGSRSFDLALRAEVTLAQGRVEAGLAHWRRAVELIDGARLPGMYVEPGLEPWALELRAVAVVAHAQHGCSPLMARVTAALPAALTTLLTAPARNQPSYSTGLPLCGALLLALGMADIDGGAATSGARLVALAERFRYNRQLQPTMSVERARQAAERADRSAYEAAVAPYADLDEAALRAAALAALRDRPTAPDRG